MEKRKFFTLPGLELRPSVVQPVASRYTDYAIPTMQMKKRYITFQLLKLPNIDRNAVIFVSHSSIMLCNLTP
jgi:hypothetical protein